MIKSAPATAVLAIDAALSAIVGANNSLEGSWIFEQNLTSGTIKDWGDETVIAGTTGETLIT